MLNAIVDKFGAALLDLVAPERCEACGGGAAGGPLCAPCAAALPWNRQACRACALPLPADGPLRACGDCLNEAPPQDMTWAAFTYRAPV
jgi:predicted amidophosphoribosyltransferase